MELSEQSLIERVTASVVHRFMSTGRTGPMLATCIGRSIGADVVVKLNGAMDWGVRGAVFELIASLMAARVGIDCPKPFLVRLESDFVEVASRLHQERARVLRGSLGLNFGTEMLKGMIIFGESAKIPATMMGDALKIFAFDGLTQNPDRSAANPNLYVRGEKLTIIDHECAFSFLTGFLRPSNAWTFGSADFMQQHALRYLLRSVDLDWPGCWDALRALNDTFFEEVRDSLPIEWNGNTDVDAIEKHVAAVLRHIPEFQQELRGRFL